MNSDLIIANNYKVVSHLCYQPTSDDYKYLTVFVDDTNRLVFYTGYIDLVRFAEMYAIETLTWPTNRDVVILRALSILVKHRDIVLAYQVFWFLYKLVAYIAASHNPPQEV